MPTKITLTYNLRVPGSFLLYKRSQTSFRYLLLVFCLSLLKAMKVTAAEREYLHEDQPLQELRVRRLPIETSLTSKSFFTLLPLYSCNDLRRSMIVDKLTNHKTT